MKNIYYAYLHSCWFSQKELREIFKNEKNPEDFFHALESDIISKFVKNTERQKQILENYAKINIALIDDVIKKYTVNIICIHDSNYPENLLNIPHTPFLLYVRWELPKQKMFWVVWSRNISSYWNKAIDSLVPEISKVFPIVSWWAAGCDTQAHISALNSGAKTIAVVGTWINIHYPVSNEKLYNKIVDSGWAVISIFRIWEPWNPYNFPVRNEIVAGLSEGILVVEAKEKSWSLITANLCLDLGKDVFSVPWDITHSSSTWTNKLIQSWEAKLVMNSNDILEEYDVVVKSSAHKNILPNLSQEELILYNIISENNYNLESIIKNLWEQSKNTVQKISLLELKGLIKKDISWKYRIS